MSLDTTALEKENLEAHVDLCAQRYHILENRMTKVENSLASLHDMISKNSKTLIATIITATGTIIAGLSSTVLVLLFQLG